MSEYVGKKVRVSGTYVCVPCGYKKRFSVGDTFPKCISCLGGGIARRNNFEDFEVDGEPIASNLDTWDLLEDNRDSV